MRSWAVDWREENETGLIAGDGVLELRKNTAADL